MKKTALEVYCDANAYVTVAPDALADKGREDP